VGACLFFIVSTGTEAKITAIIGILTGKEAAMKYRYDWEKIRAEYVTTKATQQQLADKYGCSLPTMNSHIQKGGWAAERKEYFKKTLNKLTNKRSTKQAITYDKELAALDMAMKIIEDALKDPRQFTDEDGRLSSTSLRNAVATIRDASQTKQGIENIGADTGSDEETGVIMLPQRGEIGSE
jgi:hypothetical protein